MKRILTYISVIVLAVSCRQEFVEEGPDVNLVDKTFEAYVEKGTATKIVMDGTYESEYRSILFEPQESVAVVEHDSEVVTQFKNSVEGVNTECAIFKGLVAEGEDYSAFYPYGSSVYAYDGNFCFTMPYTQSYVEDDIDDAAFPMVATLEGDTFLFKNLCGIFVLKLQGTGSVSRIVFYPKDEEGESLIVAGDAEVAYTFDPVPEMILTSTIGTFMELDCGEGVTLSETEPTPFHVVLPPNEYPSFELLIELTDGAIMTKKSEKPLTITRSQRTTAATLTFTEDVPEMSDPVDLNSDGKSANCYIISEAGTYKFSPVKGNGNESVGSVASVEVLWESFGTSETPVVGDLIQSVSYSEGSIIFSTPETYREGNAVIAAKDSDGTILWSWHVWLTDQPEEQVYYNNAGTMMDRNLGATSATSGDVGALGLHYQWGRKDPFLGSSSIGTRVLAESTIIWPSAVSSTANGTIAYTIENPTTFVTRNSNNVDWYYTDDSSTDDTRWQSNKTIYDPCPIGWRVPDGGSNGVWSKAVGSSSSFNWTYNSTDGGKNFSGKFGSSSSIWYPSGSRVGSSGNYGVGNSGHYWSVSPNGKYAYRLFFNDYVYVDPASSEERSDALYIRCQKDEETLNEVEVVDLNAGGETANCYIVSEAGTYKFSPVKGNGNESVGTVATAEVLWESFGTSETPAVGDLIKSVSYSDGSIIFSTPETDREGNAVIAAKDADETILWSWHIWLTDKPEEQVYYNNAGTMMDRNLGATSATPGDVGALGLLYQWGRKDPFLGSSSISESIEPVSTITWPSSVSSSSNNGTISYAIQNPTTYITQNGSNSDWYYTGNSSTDNSRWQLEKTIYDPCPAGWRVPDSGDNGVWSVSLGSSSSLSGYPYDATNEGMNFSGKFGLGSSIWYPAAGCRNGDSVFLCDDVGNYGYYWSVTPIHYYAYILCISSDGYVYPAVNSLRAYGRSVRCQKEEEIPNVEIDAVDLNADK